MKKIDIMDPHELKKLMGSDREKYEKYKSNLPSNFFEFEIEGGCHAYFGMYGEQKGDGTATITAEEQILKTAEYISKFIFKGE